MVPLTYYGISNIKFSGAHIWSRSDDLVKTELESFKNPI